jgi:hypothetical protein
VLRAVAHEVLTVKEKTRTDDPRGHWQLNRGIPYITAIQVSFATVVHFNTCLTN